MNTIIRTHWKNLQSHDGNTRYESLNALLAITEQCVDWAYEIWDELVENLRHAHNHQRAIAAQLLCNLAKSDPEQRMLKDFDALLDVTRDERFVTARHCLQAIWKVGVVGAPQQQLVVDRLVSRFQDCGLEKNSTLIRYDILEGLRKLYDVMHDEQIQEVALALIATEADSKYRKKYTTLWKSAVLPLDHH